QSFEPTGSSFFFTGSLKLVLERGLDEAVHRTARIFADELLALGFSVELVVFSDADSSRTSFRESGGARIIFGRLHGELVREAYQMSIGEDEILIVAGSESGFF